MFIKLFSGKHETDQRRASCEYVCLLGLFLAQQNVPIRARLCVNRISVSLFGVDDGGAFHVAAQPIK